MSTPARKVGEGMGMKTISQVAAGARGESSGMHAIWEAIRAQKTFTSQSLWTAVDKRRGGNMGTIRSYLQRLVKAGFIAVESEQKRGATVTRTYKLVRDVGVDAPRLTREGKPSTKGQQFEMMWNGMRMLGDFDHRELAALSSTKTVKVHEEHAKHYVAALHRAGYLRKTQPGHHSVRLARYRLHNHMNTGPKPPVVQKLEAVYDANRREIVWRQEESHA